MNEVDACQAVLIEVLTVLAKDLDNLAVWKARGVDLAFTFQQDVAVEGTLPNGGHNKVTAKMPIIAADLCIKAITRSERKKEKDAYDSPDEALGRPARHPRNTAGTADRPASAPMPSR